MEKKAFVTKEMIEKIAEKYPTPFHIYDEKGIRENAKAVSYTHLDAGGLDDDLDALLAGAFPEQSENSTDNASGEPESADVMDILKAAGAVSYTHLSPYASELATDFALFENRLLSY